MVFKVVTQIRHSMVHANCQLATNLSPTRVRTDPTRI